MKGIAHFMTGVALATCFPEVVVLAREGWLLPVLGGVAAMLPDLLDFRLVRYLERYDVAIDPAPDLVDDAVVVTDATVRKAAETIVEAFVGALRAAFETGGPRRLIAHTVRCGADLWRRYSLRIDPEMRTVAACIGPLVTTSQSPLAGSGPTECVWVVRQVNFPLVHDYQRHYDVDIFTGPSFTFTRDRDGVRIDFLDWHHRWTHSLPLAGALGVGVGSLGAQLWGGEVGRLVGWVSGLAFAAHALEDQLGYMGCNLLWPLVRRRQRGLGLLHAGDPAPNFLVVWTALALILYNLDRAIPARSLLPAASYLALAVVAPWALYAVRALWRHLGADGDRLSSAELGDAERAAELNEGEGR